MAFAKNPSLGEVIERRTPKENATTRPSTYVFFIIPIPFLYRPLSALKGINQLFANQTLLRQFGRLILQIVTFRSVRRELNRKKKNSKTRLRWHAQQDLGSSPKASSNNPNFLPHSLHSAIAIPPTHLSPTLSPWDYIGNPLSARIGSVQAW